MSGYNSDKNIKQSIKKYTTNKTLKNFRKTPEMLALPHKPLEYYYIHEIDPRDYYFCTQRLFKLIENDITNYGNYDDVFMKQIFMSQTGSDQHGWKLFEMQRRFQQGLSSRLGDFHEELSGKLPGYRTLPDKHWSGLNVIKDDRTAFFEWKNRADVSSDVLTNVYKKFKTLLDEGKTNYCVLVHVNVPVGWSAPLPIKRRQDGTIVVDLTEPKYKGKVFIVNGREAYTRMSGSPTFFDRLLETMAHTFKEMTFLKSAKQLSMTMNES